MKVLLAVGAVAHNFEKEFLQFITDYEKRYEATEFADRFNVFKNNLIRIDTHNAKNASWTMGLNQFADMTPDEFGQKVVRGCALKRQDRSEIEADLVSGKTNGRAFAPLEGQAPDDIDWEKLGKVSPVKNQGACGSCWAFSTTGAVESAVSIADSDPPKVLSEQELVDCATSYGNHGCEGGIMQYGFQYVIDEGGLCPEAQYPYKAKDEICEKLRCVGHRTDKISSYADVTRYSEEALMEAIAKGPVTVAIEADQTDFQLYKDGVLTAPCGEQLDHGVLAVGYAENYWKIKNSWGTSWGNKGYILLEKGKPLNCGFLQRNCAGQCGLLSQASYPIV